MPDAQLLSSTRWACTQHCRRGIAQRMVQYAIGTRARRTAALRLVLAATSRPSGSTPGRACPPRHGADVL
ncbi:MAG: hypothetical protein ACLU0Z_01980 [Oscillospiraceae bacterium]